MRLLATTLLALGLLASGPVALAQSPGAAGGASPGLSAGVPAESAPESLVLEHDQECEHEPLFDGVLVPLGAHAAHVEVTFDPETSIFTGYILDADALEPVRIGLSHFMIRITVDFLDQDRVAFLAAKEDEETGEMKGDASVFWGGNKKLIGATTFAGRIDQVTVDGKTYAGVDFSYPR